MQCQDLASVICSVSRLTYTVLLCVAKPLTERKYRQSKNENTKYQCSATTSGDFFLWTGSCHPFAPSKHNLILRIHKCRKWSLLKTAISTSMVHYLQTQRYSNINMVGRLTLHWQPFSEWEAHPFWLSPTISTWKAPYDRSRSIARQ